MFSCGHFFALSLSINRTPPSIFSAFFFSLRCISSSIQHPYTPFAVIFVLMLSGHILCLILFLCFHSYSFHTLRHSSFHRNLFSPRSRSRGVTLLVMWSWWGHVGTIMEEYRNEKSSALPLKITERMCYTYIFIVCNEVIIVNHFLSAYFLVERRTFWSDDQWWNSCFLYSSYILLGSFALEYLSHR